MFIELVDSLRCTRTHDDICLVAAVDTLHGRSIVEGTLGCPLCGSRYPIRRGVLDMRATTTEPRGTTGEKDRGVNAHAPPEDAVLRAAALLGLDGGGGVIALFGSSALLAAPLEGMTNVHALCVNAPDDVATHEATSVLRCDAPIPLAPGTLRGAIADASNASAEVLAGIARALRSGGRLVAPAHAPNPPEVRELARDEREWVGVRETAASSPISLRRA